eukprot:symbB.v1.2.030187.t2/scaffold3376.1/size58184/2
MLTPGDTSQRLVQESVREGCDFTRLILIIAWCGGLALTFRDAIFTVQSGCSVHRRFGFRTFCVVEILDTLFLLPCTVQLMYLVITYSAKAQAHLRKSEELVEEHTSSCKRMIREEFAILSEWVRQNVALGQKRFDEERHDLLRFLEQFQPMLAESADPILELEIKKFIVLWLRIYTEAFAANHEDTEDSESPDRFDVENPALWDMEIIDMVKQSCFQSAILSPSFQPPDVSSLETILEPPHFEGLTIAPRWLQWSWKPRCRLDEESVDCCFCHVDLLDGSHGLLLMALLAGMMLIPMNLAFYLFSQRTSQLAWETAWDLGPLLIYLSCLGFILCRFERVCLLGKQHTWWIAEQKKACHEICNKLKPSKKAVDQVSLWHEKTLPRLELLKEAYCQTAGLSLSDLRAKLPALNQSLLDLEHVVNSDGSRGTTKLEAQDATLRQRFDEVIRRSSARSSGQLQDFQEQLEGLRLQMAEDHRAIEMTNTSFQVNMLEDAAPSRNLDSFLKETPRNLDSFLRDT